MKTKPRIIAGMASIAKREEAMYDSVESLLPQVDRLHVYLNDYDYIPHWDNDKITIHHAPVGDLGDSGKFYGKDYDKRHRYYFSVDDDLIYPPDYVETTLKHLKTYPIVTYHGRLMLSQPVRSYYNAIKRPYHVNSNVDIFAKVHVGGTGVMAMRSNSFSYTDCLHPNMSDIWVGLYAQRNRLPVTVAPHRKGWIKLSDKINHHKDTIWAAHNRKDAKQTEVFNSVKWQLF